MALEKRLCSYKFLFREPGYVRIARGYRLNS
jgi:hypothetical protein